MLGTFAEPATRGWVDNSILQTSVDDLRPYPLDAIFIPTLGQRSNLTDLVEACRFRAPKVFVLGTGVPSPAIDLNAANLYSDIPRDFGIPAEQFNASVNPSAVWGQKFDLPAKRNFALELSRIEGFQSIAFVDDDILASPNFLCVPAAALDGAHDMIAFYSLNFPDVSVIDHIERMLTNVRSKVSPSGNCLILKPNCVSGHFPHIYNEDWFFIIGAVRRGAKLVGGGHVTHESHEPWRDLDRVRFEQFGDIAAAGLASLDIFGSLLGDLSHWSECFEIYVDRLRHLRALSGATPVLRCAIDAAISAVADFDARKVRDFVNAWDKLETEPRLVTL